MITLRHFKQKDAQVLKELKYQKHSEDEIKCFISEWNKLSLNGKYFEMFAVCKDNTIIGTISLYQHSGYVISIGPEIYPDYRRNGYAYEAMTKALSHAKDIGYKIVSAQIRKDNDASIKLHEKLGFLLDQELINKRGSNVYIYLKLL